MTDFTSGYTTLLKRQWRALVYDYDAMLEGIGDGSKLYCLTNFQAMWLQQNVDYFRWQTRWNNLSVDADELGIQADALELALMTCVDIQPYMLSFNYNVIVTQVLGEYDTLYDSGGIPELNANTPTDFYNGDDSTPRNEALCTAVNIYVKSYAQNWLTLAQATLGITVIVAIAVSLSGVGGIIAGTVLAGLALFTQTAINAFTDDTAIDNVVCCMLEALDGAVVNQDNFTESLDACGFTGGTNEAIIRDIIASDLDQFDNWLSFLNSLGDSYVLSQIGVFDCPCLDHDWSKIWDFTVEKGDGDGWQQVTWGDGWFTGLGWRSERSGSRENNYLYNYMPDHADITFIKMTFGNSGTPVNFSSGGSTGYIVMWTWNGGSTERVRYDAAGTPVNTDVVIYNNSIPINIDQWASLSNPFIGSNWYIIGAEIRGKGVNPYL